MAKAPVPTSDDKTTPFDTLAETSQQSLAAMSDLHSRMFKGAVTLNAEVMDFARHRFGADVETSKKLAASKSLPDSVKTISEHYQAAMRDYADQTSKLMRIGMSAAMPAGKTGAAGETDTQA